MPIVDIQKRIETLRKNITEIENNIVLMREKQLTAPQDSLMPGVISDTVTSLGNEIADSEKRIALNREQIETAKDEVHKGLQKSGIKLTKKQVNLLMGSVLSGDLLEHVKQFVLEGHFAHLHFTRDADLWAALLAGDDGGG